MGNNADFSQIKKQLEATTKDLEKKLAGYNNQLADIFKKAEVVREKKGKFNKAPCTMQLMTDNSVNVIFDNPTDAIKIFE